LITAFTAFTKFLSCLCYIQSCFVRPVPEAILHFCRLHIPSPKKRSIAAKKHEKFHAFANPQELRTSTGSYNLNNLTYTKFIENSGLTFLVLRLTTFVQKSTNNLRTECYIAAKQINNL
jgi:hypothetical protein